MIRFYRDGRESGFPLCCIAYFLVRHIVWKLTGKLIELSEQPENSEHVLCPFHLIWHKFFPMKGYHTCYTCNWQQYGNPNCVKCVDCKHSYKPNEARCLVCNYRRRAIGWRKVNTIPYPTIYPVYDKEIFEEIK